ncbi:fimbria/pilus periplasmic chaperone [Acinetobacter faecalis]|uniref:fimbrial biogenesis chaperone n=1 Tax=Acinetobacter faecalis TaxID=2665161 RepID=UPI002A919CEF|nr:fimbria/pilus periplasmic chaperone [Acinetobacter faecalis]MDY6482084.1 fimbria/pilus periplasmic chaperone [Acinetobacter faecalis]
MHKLISIYLAKLVNKALFLLVVAVLTTQIIYAKSNFLIWPIYPIIESQDKAAPVWLENIGDEASIVQIRVFKWLQNDNKDQYQNQQEIIASPPIVKVAAGDKQMIRLTKAINIPDSKEYSYRIVVDELPVDLEKKDATSSVSFKMRYSLPLFVYGKGIGSGNSVDTKKLNSKNLNARPILNWSLVKNNNKDYLEIENYGLLSVRVSGFQIEDKKYKSMAGNNTFGYVLAGGKLAFDINQDFKSLLLQNKPIYAIIGQDKEPILLIKK